MQGRGPAVPNTTVQLNLPISWGISILKFFVRRILVYHVTMLNMNMSI